ncbi:hypothetical protein Pla108_21120 [Botrimarina colliarenosi]|uniref:Probable inorganic carbon transporter subunit DabA n=2 Tax=Botrimarina colliarenosi TaxID=2528001 RepID=A0A5C6AEW3_9BACT|nr:hypothetical protein Pla108_21120 [Botrimarina colliarenosi]
MAATRDSIEATIEHLAHLLPSQGPITVFVHHNTLHALENLPFSEAVFVGADLYDCHPFLPEDAYRREFERGRITADDLERELHASFDQEGDTLIACLGTRHDLWMSMLAHPLREGRPAEVRWFIEETEALYRFRAEAAVSDRGHCIADARRWLVRDFVNGDAANHPMSAAIQSAIEGIGSGKFETWTAEDWEAFTLHLLWATCRHGAELSELPAEGADGRRRDPSAAAADELVDSVLIRFCSAFLDQGYANWDLPQRVAGLFESFRTSFLYARPVERWLHPLPGLVAEEASPTGSIRRSLAALGVPAAEQEAFLQAELLKLRGWAGMIWQMETNAEWTARPAPRGSLVEYVAVRLLLLRLAREATESERAPALQPMARDDSPRTNLAFQAFQIAQIRGWSPVELLRLTPVEWRLLMSEIAAFPSRRRRQFYHEAYERHYREAALKALRRSCLASERAGMQKPPAYQTVFCIDDREESFRRHLEEVDPEGETLGSAGFFGVAMYYRGLGESQFRPLCPVNVKPQHDVIEAPAYSAAASNRRRATARKAMGQTAYRVTQGSRSFLGGMLTAVAGAVAAAPLVFCVLFPRMAARLRHRVGQIVTIKQTEICIEAGEAGSGLRGYTIPQMADIVNGLLVSSGLGGRLSDLVVIFGHGSSSLNNPHAAAYDCGACGGGRGGPNARAFAQMANDARVRAELAQRGVQIPPTCSFVGAYHNTCNDSVEYYDLDNLPAVKRPLLERLMASVEVARRRDAHERCRRFESADLSLTADAALKHVEGRSEDLSQVRSECGHATNAMCLVGRRNWSRGLYLDRRAFLTSYDPRLDDENHSVLARILGAVIPVCGGINLEYYFSRVDNKGYGCGTKLPHNVTSLLGVMDGAGSDLRTGLPWQMVEIHEPIRLLFVIETMPQAMLKIMDDSPAIHQLVTGNWVQVATIEPATGQIQVFRNGRFEPFDGAPADLPVVADSTSWWRGQRDHLGFALVETDRRPRVVAGAVR